ncbi:CsgG/HfaB family protein [Draconibacterium mangrovi]|uniref:CsgG/HfaB family protein n=1 Tax=Draconibacterium mangrovi TaxID=2697469 RepID=UPI0013D87A23|nr:CsgG/HfaB family protein [Draconibacterium mangrovi]
MLKLQRLICRVLLFCIIVSVTAGCSPYFYQPLGKEREAQLGPETPVKKDLLDLPQPKEPIVVAVYKFRDQTGQYKASDVGANWSTAVTQGATNILVRALEESGWFVPIERENISNLLNERKIIRSSREQYEGNNEVMLPPLLFAGVLLEGGIVSYETNIYTGGAGVRYFGTDASAQYREDRVSIYLRAVSTSNGKILKTIYTTKSILSQEVSMGVFRYVKYKRLLEAETGYTYNEPTELAVTEAIEKAVHGLIIEGVLDNLWSLENQEEIKDEQIQNYMAEREDRVDVDHMGRPFEQHLRGKMFTSILGTGQFYAGDYSISYIRPGATLELGYALHKNFSLEIDVGYQRIHIDELMASEEYYADMSFMYLLNPKGKFSPLFGFGGGAYYDFESNVGLSDNRLIPYISYRAGFEYLLGNRLAVIGKVYVNQLFSDKYDGDKNGQFNDHIWGFKLGLKYYLGKN